MMNVPIPDITNVADVAGKKAVLLFWAPWHEASMEGGPMDLVLRTLASASTGNPDIIFGRVEAEKVPSVAQTYQVTVVPTFVLLHANGQVFQSIQGGSDNISQITQAVQSLIASANASAGTVQATTTPMISAEEQLTKRLEKLVSSSPVMLFMKGVPQAPRCGFSRQAVELLEQENIPFGSFDILTDEQVRQGLKKYSDWPTYPQVYVNGELMGGLDILKEMKEEEGGLKQQFNLSAEVVSATTPKSLNDRLKELTHQSPVMLFMKGLPSAPRCGFSRQMVEILDSLSVNYDTFDILQDEEVRQGLKEYSDWPTYPQLYANGELLGGLDICKEMVESGDLKDMLTAAK